MDTERDWKPSKKRTADREQNRHHGAGEKKALYGRAVEAFRTAESTVPGWDETKRMILTGHQREHKMIPNNKTATTFWTRKPALISAFSFIILIAFFAVGGMLLMRVNVEEGVRVAREEDAALG